MALTNLKLKSLGNGVYEALKSALLSCELEPGQRLVEKELISFIGTSRTPIREAIIKLEQEGLVTRHNGKGGYFAASIDENKLEEIYGLRNILESYCIGLTIDRITDEELSYLEQIIREEKLPGNQRNIHTLIELDTKFHETIYRASRNKKLYEILSNLRNQIYRCRAMSFKSRERKSIPLWNHKDLFRAIKNKNKRLAKKLVTDTISRSKRIVLQTLLEKKGK
jgi:DNA-binding GntR family transcriptional regulator